MAKRFWGFTWNYKGNVDVNHDIDKYFDILEFHWKLYGDFTFIYGQEERGGLTERLHIQGMICLNRPLRLAGLKKLFSNDAEKHINWRVWDTREHAYTYCSKESFENCRKYEWGVLNSQGRSHEWEVVQKCLDEGVGMTSIAQEHFNFYLRHNRNLVTYELNHSKVAERWRNQKSEQPKLFHLYGASGVGKSQTVRMIAETSGLAMFEPAIGGANDWWDGALGSELLFLDDFYGGIRFNQLMNLLDGSSTMQLQTKGSFIDKPKWKAIFITSNFALETLYPNVDSGRKRGLIRRFESFGRSVKIPFALDYKYIWEKRWPEGLLGSRPDCIPWPNSVTEIVRSENLPDNSNSVTGNEVPNNTKVTSTTVPVRDPDATPPPSKWPVTGRTGIKIFIKIEFFNKMITDGFEAFSERCLDGWKYYCHPWVFEKYVKYQNERWSPSLEFDIY